MCTRLRTDGDACVVAPGLATLRDMDLEMGCWDFVFFIIKKSIKRVVVNIIAVVKLKWSFLNITPCFMTTRCLVNPIAKSKLG